jgi:DNA-directed RNA polymerase subunit K/omega
MPGSPLVVPRGVLVPPSRTIHVTCFNREVNPVAENDKEEVVEEKEPSPEEKGEAQGEAEESENVNKNYPANKYELAIVAAQEARRMNEFGKEEEEEEGVRVTEKALDKVRTGDVHYSVVDEQDT